MNNPFLQIQFGKSYPPFGLQVDVQLGPEITAILGVSGSGKTTLLNCISGLITPDSGEITLDTTVLFSSANRINISTERRRIGYVFQDVLLFPHLTVQQNILYGFERTPKGMRHVDPLALIELLELESLLSRKPNYLSGGEAHRVALARAIASSPQLLLLDEPLASLDLGFRNRILEYLRTLHLQMLIPMLYVTHSFTEALALSDRVLILSGGRVIEDSRQDNSTKRTLDQNLEPGEDLENNFQVTLVGRPNHLRLTKTMLKDQIVWIPQRTAQPMGSTITVAVHASNILLSDIPPNNLSAENILMGVVKSVFKLRETRLVSVDAGAPFLVQVTERAQQQLNIHPGQSVFLIFNSESIRRR